MHTDTEQDVDLELIMLEELFNEDLKCQVVHKESRCTIQITSKIAGCRKRDTLMCEGGRVFKQWQMDVGVVCLNCERPSADCWVITPV